MPFFLANPWGLLGLLAVPALVAVHVLQEQSRRVPTSTLFLLEHAQPETTGGWRVERFRNSLPFWMQLVAALAVTWLLADPRLVRADSRQTVAVVLDSSASMQAGREATLALLARRLARVAAAAAKTDWHLLETGPRRPPLYAGPRLAELLAAADRWRPTLGTHPCADALAVAAALVPADAGCVILVSDRPVDLPAGVALLSAGAPFDNVGFSGGDVTTRDGRTVWRAIVTNHGSTEQSRSLTLRLGAAAGEVAIPRADTAKGDTAKGDTGDAAAPRSIRLAAGASRTLEGEWPAGEDRLVLALAGDRFAWDDTLPLLRPVPRTVRVTNRLAGPVGKLLGRMVAAAGDTAEAAGDADLVLDTVDAAAMADAVPMPASLLVPAGDAAETAAGAGDAAAADATPAAAGADAGESAAAADPAGGRTVAFDPAFVAAEDHPLVRDLAWGGLLSGPAAAMAAAPGDVPLLWKGGRPLAVLRPPAGAAGGRRGESLVLAFDVAASTAARTPAVVVLVQRFVDRVRAGIERPWSANVETGQLVELPGGRQARAPAEPGFFTLSTGTATLTGAAQFADARESDFRAAAAADTLEPLRLGQALRQSVADPWGPLWMTLAGAALLVAWAAKGRSA